MIKIGQRIRDKITGFEGVVIGKTIWLTGCNTFGLQSEKTTDDGTPLKTQWFDENRLEKVEGADVVNLDMSGREEETQEDSEPQSEDTPGVRRAVPRRPGGPQSEPQRSVEPGEA